MKKTGRQIVSYAKAECERGKLGGRARETLVRTSKLKIASAVREDNWSEGRLRCSWPEIFVPRPSAATVAGELAEVTVTVHSFYRYFSQ
jgi:hypothetical protein